MDQPSGFRRIAAVQMKISRERATATLLRAIAYPVNQHRSRIAQPSANGFINSKKDKWEVFLLQAQCDALSLIKLKQELSYSLKFDYQNPFDNNIDFVLNLKLMQEILLLQHQIDPDASSQTYLQMYEMAKSPNNFLMLAKTQVYISSKRTMDCLKAARDKVMALSPIDRSRVLEKIVEMQSQFDILGAIKTAFLIDVPYLKFFALIAIHKTLRLSKNSS